MSRSAQEFVVTPGNSLSGEVTVAGDKSISHRAIMFGAIASGCDPGAGFSPWRGLFGNPRSNAVDGGSY